MVTKTGRRRATKKGAVKKAKAVPGDKPNLVVTYDPNHEAMARQEIEFLFKRIKVPVSFSSSEVNGLFKLRTKDSRRAVQKLAVLSEREPGTFLLTYHYVPIDEWTASNVKDMRQAVGNLESEIKDSEKWKLDLKRRHWDKVSEGDLIAELTDVVDKPKVDLDNPDKIIQVEIIGDEAGISLLKEKDRLYLKAP